MTLIWLAMLILALAMLLGDKNKTPLASVHLFWSTCAVPLQAAAGCCGRQAAVGPCTHVHTRTDRRTRPPPAAAAYRLWPGSGSSWPTVSSDRLKPAGLAESHPKASQQAGRQNHLASGRRAPSARASQPASVKIGQGAACVAGAASSRGG